MAEDFPDPPNPPIGEGDEDSRFFVDMRDQPPANPPLTNPLFSEILPPTESPPDKRWNPSSDEAMGFPLLRACIKDDINGEKEFTTQIGRIYWRGEPEPKDTAGSPPGANEGESLGEGLPIEGLTKDECNVCLGDPMGADCFAPLSHAH